MFVNGNTVHFEFFNKAYSLRLIVEHRHYNAAYIQAAGTENVYETQHVGMIGNAEIAPVLIVFNVHRADDDQYFRFVFQLAEHL